MPVSLTLAEQDRFKKILERAAHPTTPENEAMICLRKAKSIAENKGCQLIDIMFPESFMEDLLRSQIQTMSEEARSAKIAAASAKSEATRLRAANAEKNKEIEKLRRLLDKAAVDGARSEINTLTKKVKELQDAVATYELIEPSRLQKIHDLEIALLERDAEIASLKTLVHNDAAAEIAKLEKIVKTQEAEIAAIKSQAKANPKADIDLSFHAFRLACLARFNNESGWQTIFCEASGTPHHQLQVWRKKGQVPSEAFDALDLIDPDNTHDAKSPRKGWSEKEKSRVAELFKEGKKLPEVAAICTAEFGRKITQNAVRGAKHRLQEQGKL